MENEKRSHYIDVLKTILIFMVVLGHCIQYGSGESFLSNLEFYECPVFKTIYTFHMPAFMIISGYLFFMSCKRHSNKELLLSRIRSLLIPNLVWCVLLSTVILVFSQKSIGGGIAYSRPILYTGFGICGLF